MKVLVTTLGRGRRDENGYRVAKYRFADGTTSRETPFFGLALMEYLARQGDGLDKVVVLGTTGSVWDAWWQASESMLENKSELFHRLGDMVENAEGKEELLAELSVVLSEAFGKTFECKFIPSGITDAEQMDILQIINSVGEKGDTVYLDVTHGFRHLPMLEMMSAFLMKSNYSIGGLFYGAFENKDADDITPVVSLTGLLHLQEWVEAMAVLRETGNVMPLARIETMKSFRADLEQYQFFIQMNNIGNARGCANRIIGGLRNDDISAEVKLFRGELEDVFRWGGDQNYARRQLAQAKVAFERCDNLRAIIMLNEAVISAHVEDYNHVLDVEYRDRAAESLYNAHIYEWYILRRLRNSTAHDGVRNEVTERTIKRMRSSKDSFEREMKKLFRWAEQQIER